MARIHVNLHQRALASTVAVCALLAMAGSTYESETAFAAEQSPQCHSAQLRLSPGVAFAAANEYSQTMVFTNVTRTTCTLDGYPGLWLVGRDGKVLRVSVRHGGGYLFADHGPRLVRLAKGGKASFAFGGPSVSQPSGRLCPRVVRVRASPPGERKQISLAVRAVACSSGISVTAVGPGPDSARLNGGEATKPVINSRFHVIYRQPRDWTPTPDSPPGYGYADGPDGWIALGAGYQRPFNLANACHDSADVAPKPFGSSPKIRISRVDNHPACFITPSSDAPAAPRRKNGPRFQAAEVLIKYRKPLIRNRTNYLFLLISADPTHLQSIVASVRLTRGY
jgi:Protein of unknown function (DUF4232)